MSSVEKVRSPESVMAAKVKLVPAKRSDKAAKGQILCGGGASDGRAIKYPRGSLLELTSTNRAAVDLPQDMLDCDGTAGKQARAET